MDRELTERELEALEDEIDREDVKKALAEVEAGDYVKIEEVEAGLLIDKKYHRKLLPFRRSGAWTTPVSFYYASAYRCHKNYVRYLNNINAIEQRVRDDNIGVESGLVDHLIDEETNELCAQAETAIISAHIFICMTLEAFINYYGIKRMGEKYYKKNLERLGITEKVAIIALSCSGILLEPDCDIIKKLRKLFDKINQLVHPKAREIEFDRLQDFAYIHPRDWNIGEYLLEVSIY
ncbi:MAG: hypothetical protein V1797_13690 [Pseudomonadota bacterium]